MENTISFTFSESNGHATIVLDEFFPTNTTRLRKLLKMINEDHERRDKLLYAIIQYCTQSAAALLNSRASWANQCVNSYTRAEELQPEIEKLTCSIECTTKYWNSYQEQLKDWKVQLRAMKKKQRDALNTYRICKQKFANAKKQAERLEKNAEVLYDEQNKQG
jgi:hypothetical protein